MQKKVGCKSRAYQNIVTMQVKLNDFKHNHEVKPEVWVIKAVKNCFYEINKRKIDEMKKNWKFPSLKRIFIAKTNKLLSIILIFFLISQQLMASLWMLSTPWAPKEKSFLSWTVINLWSETHSRTEFTGLARNEPRSNVPPKLFKMRGRIDWKGTSK